MLREPNPDDAPEINAAIRESFAELHRWLPWADHLPSVDETREHLTLARDKYHAGEDWGLFIWDRASGEFVGAIGLHRRLADTSRREIGYWIRTSAAGRGYATEAVRAVTRWGFDDLKLSALEIHSSERNVASHRVAQAAGFSKTATLADDRVDPDGQRSSTLVFERKPRRRNRMAALSLALRSLAWTILLPGLFAGYLPWRYFGVRDVQLDWARPEHVLGLIAIVGGAVLLALCIWEFARRGRGTLSPVDPPRELVVRGLYRYMRNPMYLSVTLIVLGEWLLTGSRALLIYWAVWFVAVNLFVMGYEEPTLRARFGASYDDYRRRVGRWIPRFNS